MTSQPDKEHAVREVYLLLRMAAARRQPVAATYDGLLRLICPHVLGRKAGRLRVLCYQFGGNSNSGLAVASEAMGGWRFGNTIDGAQAEFLLVPVEGAQPPPPTDIKGGKPI